jgi:hypothetical protein
MKKHSLLSIWHHSNTSIVISWKERIFTIKWTILSRMLQASNSDKSLEVTALEASRKSTSL